MTRSDLIAEIAATARQLRATDAKLIVATVFERIAEALAAGQRVELRGFGAFTIRRRDAHTARNPRTGEEVPVEQKGVPFFKASRPLTARLNRAATKATKRL